MYLRAFAAFVSPVPSLFAVMPSAAAALAMPTEWEDTACEISVSSAKDGYLATGSTGAPAQTGS